MNLKSLFGIKPNPKQSTGQSTFRIEKEEIRVGTSPFNRPILVTISAQGHPTPPKRVAESFYQALDSVFDTHLEEIERGLGRTPTLTMAKLGALGNVAVRGDKIFFGVRLTTPACGHSGSIFGAIQNELQRRILGFEIHVVPDYLAVMAGAKLENGSLTFATKTILEEAQKIQRILDRANSAPNPATRGLLLTELNSVVSSGLKSIFKARAMPELEVPGNDKETARNIVQAFTYHGALIPASALEDFESAARGITTEPKGYETIITEGVRVAEIFHGSHGENSITPKARDKFFRSHQWALLSEQLLNQQAEAILR